MEHFVSIIGFSGLGTVGIPSTLRHENGLIYLGHVGVTLDAITIYGFSPSPASIQAFGPTLSRHLLMGGAVLGKVNDDTEHFHRAYEIYEKGLSKYTQVWEIPMNVDTAIYDRIRFRLDEQLKAGTIPPWYKLPTIREAPMPESCNNCATWPRTLGITIPEKTGILSNYIDILRLQGKPWQP